MSIDWIAIEGAFRAGSKSLRAIGADHGVSEGAIRKRAKRGGWLRDPEGTKRERVKAVLAGGTQNGTQYAERTLADEVAKDAEDMQRGLTVARQCLVRLIDLVVNITDPRDIKTTAETNRICIETIRLIRGLNDAAIKIDVSRASDEELAAMAKGRG